MTTLNKKLQDNLETVIEDLTALAFYSEVGDEESFNFHSSIEDFNSMANLLNQVLVALKPADKNSKLSPACMNEISYLLVREYEDGENIRPLTRRDQ